jgi:hypothetical protein
MNRPHRDVTGEAWRGACSIDAFEFAFEFAVAFEFVFEFVFVFAFEFVFAFVFAFEFESVPAPNEKGRRPRRPSPANVSISLPT